ncbi:MAG: conjugal transfer protein TraH [Pseudomonadota bacterium]|mgnify:FL=1
MKKNSLLLLLMLSSSSAWAGGIDTELTNVWQSLGGSSVSNSANYYKGQKAGHYSMGSMYFSRAKKNRPLISVNFPEIDFDKSCYSQGVLNFGGISFISGDELKDKMKSIAQQSGLMLAYLGVSSISPIIGETLQEVYSKLQELGGFLADECQAAKQIVGFAGDMMTQHSEMAKGIYAKTNLSKGGKDDLSSSYKDFPKNKKKLLDDAAEKDEKLTLEDINLAWKALEKLKMNGTTNIELKELMMTISGTIIITSNGNGMPNYQYISSKVTNPSLLEALIKGGRMKVLQCGGDHKKCLKVIEGEKTVPKEQAFEERVLEFLKKIRTALEEDKELEDAEQHFLANSGIPAYAIYEKLYQYTNGNPEYEQGLLVELIAWNILYNYLTEMLKEVNEATNNLQIAANSELKEFKESIKNAQKLLTEYEMTDLSRYKLQLQMIKRAEGMEDMMASEVSQLLNMEKN